MKYFPWQLPGVDSCWWQTSIHARMHQGLPSKRLGQSQSYAAQWCPWCSTPRMGKERQTHYHTLVKCVYIFRSMRGRQLPCERRAVLAPYTAVRAGAVRQGHDCVENHGLVISWHGFLSQKRQKSGRACDFQGVGSRKIISLTGVLGVEMRKSQSFYGFPHTIKMDGSKR